jgi:hypothetical protein
VRIVAAVALLAAAACARTVPDHDNRIFTAPVAAKLTVGDLVRAFADDAASARDRFSARAVEISGVVRDMPAAGQPATLTLVASAPTTGAQDAAPATLSVSLHEDRAAEVLKTLTDGQRATLKCYCEVDGPIVRLKSCVVP